MLDYIPLTEAAKRARVAHVTAWKWARRYEGLAVQVGGRWRVDPAALARLLAGERLPRRAS